MKKLLLIAGLFFFSSANAYTLVDPNYCPTGYTNISSNGNICCVKAVTCPQGQTLSEHCSNGNPGELKWCCKGAAPSPSPSPSASPSASPSCCCKKLKSGLCIYKNMGNNNACNTGAFPFTPSSNANCPQQPNAASGPMSCSDCPISTR